MSENQQLLVLPDFGNLAAHVASAIGTLKGYGHETHASTKGLQYVLDELMKLYAKAQVPPKEVDCHYCSIGGYPVDALGFHFAARGSSYIMRTPCKKLS